MAWRSAMMLDPGSINLNTGSFGPTPWPVFRCAETWRRQLASQPMRFFLRQIPLALDLQRDELARFLGCDPSGLVFFPNVTLALNAVIQSLPQILGPTVQPSETEILVTDLEYGSLIWAWERLCQTHGFRLKKAILPRVPKEPQEILQALEDAVSPSTRVVFFSHVTSPTGLVLPAREICQWARRKGLLSIVDGAHAPAFLPLDLQSIGADYYGANCHKWLLAPMGCGFLQAPPDHLLKLEPLWVSWGYKSQYQLGPHEKDGLGSTPAIRRLEFPGSMDPCAWLAVGEAIEFHQAVGPSQIHLRQTALIQEIRALVDRVVGLEPQTPPPGPMAGGMVAYKLPYNGPAQPLRDFLWHKYRLEVNFIERPQEPLLIRFSAHFYTTRTEIACLETALPDLLRFASTLS